MEKEKEKKPQLGEKMIQNKWASTSTMYFFSGEKILSHVIVTTGQPITFLRIKNYNIILHLSYFSCCRKC